ncbi:MAG: hypothetical protein HY695_20390 [Deltaproteobacteria bacterium]|nr:hypothetical protein [Deltaproteobacteria bacterium]
MDPIPLILLEFNELSPVLMQRFIRQGELPNFKIMYDESQVFLTDAEEKPPYLEPWIQWVSVHSGMRYKEHGVFHLGDGFALKERRIWDLMSERGLRVWICGSMNVRYDLPLNGYVLPDPWTQNPPPHPTGLMPYFRFVQRNVQEHTRDRAPLGALDYIEFLGFMARHGLSPSTIFAILRQIAAERGRANRWKRAFIMDRLQFDLFRSVYRRLKPHFSTFFLNSTAHMQHMYWRNLEPELFKRQPAAAEQEEFRHAVLLGYREMDRLIGRFRRLFGAGSIIIFCTALSQQPCLIYEEGLGGKVVYRPRDFEALLAFAGINGRHRVEPVMAGEFHVYFENEREATEARQRLLDLRVGEQRVQHVEQKGTDVFGGCIVFEELPADATLRLAGTDRAAPFFEIFYRIEGRKSGIHHPDGMLWIRLPDNSHRVHEGKVSLTSIAPTILRMFGVPRPSTMRGDPLEFGGRPAAAA